MATAVSLSGDVQVQWGGKGEFKAVRAELKDDVLVFVTKEELQVTASCERVKVSVPNSARKGQPQSFRVDLLVPDSAKHQKYIISVPTSFARVRWESALRKVAGLKLELQLTGDDLSDLAFSFQACDDDHNGTIDSKELLSMLGLFADLTEDVCADLIRQAKAGVDEWTALQDEQGVDGSFGGVGAEAAALADMVGEKAQKGNRGRIHAGLDVKSRPGSAAIAMVTQSKAVKFVPGASQTLGTAMTYGQKMAMVSAGLSVYTAKTAGGLAKTGLDLGGAVVQTGLDITESATGIKTGIDLRTPRANKFNTADVEQFREQLKKELNFPEFAFMMQSDFLQELVLADWRLMSRQMGSFRRAFDTCDVDGDNELEFGELQMAMLALDPSSNMSDDDLAHLWDVMKAWAVDNGGAVRKATVGTTDDVVLDFTAFLHGMAAVQRNPKTSEWVDILKPNRWELLSLLVDTPVSQAEEDEILSGLSTVERIGFGMAQRWSISTKMNEESTREVLSRAGKGTLRELVPRQLERMTSLQRRCVLYCGLIGLLFSSMPAAAENFLGYQLEVDGFKDAYWVCHRQSMINTLLPNATQYVTATTMSPDAYLCSTIHVNASSCIDTSVLLDAAESGNAQFYPPHTQAADRNDVAASERAGWVTIDSDQRSADDICAQCICTVCACVHHANGELVLGNDNDVLKFWAVYIPVLFLFGVIEIFTLFYCAMTFTTQVAWALDIRLSPVNADRAFVTNVLVRTAFEMGDSNKAVLGVDPGASTSDYKKFIVLLVYKLKVVLTGMILKLLVNAVASVEFSYWSRPWLGMVVATVAWDAYVGYSILMQARIRGLGVYASVEIMNEVLDMFYSSTDDIPRLAKVQITRAVGVAIVVNGCLHPSMELQLRHAIQFLGLRGTGVVSTSGVLDDVDGFLSDLHGHRSYYTSGSGSVDGMQEHPPQTRGKDGMVLFSNPLDPATDAAESDASDKQLKKAQVMSGTRSIDMGAAPKKKLFDLEKMKRSTDPESSSLDASSLLNSGEQLTASQDEQASAAANGGGGAGQSKEVSFSLTKATNGTRSSDFLIGAG